jgi:hypothetical protein
MTAAKHVLDQAYTLPRIEALAAEPGVYAERLAEELPAAATLAELEARDAVLAGALGDIDALIARAMRIRLDHALAADPSADASIAAPTRSVFAQTIVGYADRLSLLGDRARDVAARGRARDPDFTADAVVDAARAVLALRDGLRDGVLALIGRLAEAAAPEADRRARDRQLDDAERKRWSAMRRELEAVAADPARVTAAAMASRLAAHPAQIDEPDPSTEPTFASMIELD